jgi:hypothetical protein
LFLFSAGVVLPSVQACEGLQHRPELWRHLRHELQEQCISIGRGMPSALWILGADGAAAPAALAERIATLKESLPGIQAFNPEVAASDVGRWLKSSAVVVLLELEPAPGQATISGLALRNQRLNQALPEHSTLVMTMPRQGDGILLTERFAGSRRLADEQTNHPACDLAAHSSRWQTAQQRLINTMPNQGLSEQGWTTALRVGWALEQSTNLLVRSDRRLLLKAIAMAVLLVAVAPLLHQLTTRLVPAVVLLAAGAGLLCFQPLRQRALQWWCLAQALWVQDTWHRFSLREPVAERLPREQPLDSRRQPGQLLQLLRAHDLALAVEPTSPDWGREALADAIAALEQHIDRISTTIDQHRREQRLMVVPAGICAILLLGVAMLNAVLIKQVILVSATALIALWLHRPLPLVRRERLIRHQRALETEITGLRTGLASADLSRTHQRDALVGSIQRVGVELIDLANDALEAAQWTWTFRR